MSPQKRLLLIVIATAVVIGGAGGYAAVRAWWWHQHGWSGIFFYPHYPERDKARHNAKPGEILMTQGNTPASRIFQARDQVVSIDGIPLNDTRRLRALEQGLRKGSSVTYRINRNGQIRDVSLALVSPLRSTYIVVRTLVAYAVALTFIVVAMLVFVRRPDDQRATVFYFLALVSALALLGSAATIYESTGGRGILPSFGFSTFTPILVFVCTIAYAPLLLHFALIFPRERPIVERKPHLIRWIYAGAVMAASITGSMGYLLLRLFEDPSAIEQTVRRIDRTMGYFFSAVVIGGLLIALQVVWAGRRTGVIQAFIDRPFRSAYALFAFMLGAGAVVGRYGVKVLAVVTSIGSMLLPLVVIGTYPIFACIALARSYRQAGVEEKRQVQWPVWGLLITLAAKFLFLVFQFGVAAFVSIRNESMMGWTPFFRVLDVASTLLTVIVPLSFAAAILKYRLMNIDVIIRKTVVYAILSGAIVIFYLGAVGLLGTVLVNVAGVRNQTMVIGATLIVALAFVPMRNKLQTLVERNLFRQKYDYAAALRAVSAETLAANDLGTYLTSAAEKTQQALQTRALVLFVSRHDELVAMAKIGVADSVLGTLRVPRAELLPLLNKPFDPRKQPLPDSAANALKKIDAALVVPINTPGTSANGFIAVAPKLAGGEYEAEDVEFLRAIADQIDIALDRIRLQREDVDYSQARTIQEGLLPREMPRLEGIDVSGFWQPARTMGGDYYDLLKLSETELAVCIGDVAGKGMPAALLMSGLQAAVRATASSSSRDLCERVRRVVVSSLSGGRFVTFFYATLDTAAKRLRWTNAGHNAPILARADGTIVRLAEGGPAISRLFKDTRYEEHDIAIEPGDRLVLFTDGVSEASDRAGDMFGEQRVEELVQAMPNATADQLQQLIVNAVLSFAGGEVEDDLTLVVVRVNPTASAA